MTGPAGVVYSSVWCAAVSWQPWYSIHPELQAQPGAAVTAVWAPYKSDQSEVCLIGQEGGLYSTAWEANTSWQPWYSIHPLPQAQPGPALSAVWSPTKPH